MEAGKSPYSNPGHCGCLQSCLRMCDDTWTADRRGMVRRCEFVPMDTRENGKCWTKSILDTKETRTCGVASSANASFVSPSETVRHFPSTQCQLSAVEDTRIIRLPRDSVCFEDHCYTRAAARADLCIKCGLRLSGSGGQVPTPPDPPSLPSGTAVQSRLLGMRDELFYRAGGGSAAHLRELVSLQTELILGQQEQLLQRNAQLNALSQDKALVSLHCPSSVRTHTHSCSVAEYIALWFLVCGCVCVPVFNHTGAMFGANVQTMQNVYLPMAG